MASNTRIGGKAPRSVPKRALMIVIAPKGGGTEPDADDMPGARSGGPSGMSNAERAAATPATGPGPISDDGGAPKPGEALFHDQRQLCSNCNYFDPDGADGVGECLKRVPEADFAVSDPDASHCKFWEAQNQRSAQSAAQTGTTTPPPTPPPNLPPAA